MLRANPPTNRTNLGLSLSNLSLFLYKSDSLSKTKLHILPLYLFAFFPTSMNMAPQQSSKLVLLLLSIYLVVLNFSFIPVYALNIGIQASSGLSLVSSLFRKIHHHFCFSFNVLIFYILLVMILFFWVFYRAKSAVENANQSSAMVRIAYNFGFKPCLVATFICVKK